MDAPAAESKTVRVNPEDARAFVEAVLLANGVSGPNAAITARGLVQADLRGVDSHGINRLPSYVARIRAGVLDPKAEPTVTNVTPVVAQVSFINCPYMPGSPVLFPGGEPRPQHTR